MYRGTGTGRPLTRNPPHLTEQRFDFLRNIFRSNLETSRTNVAAEVMEEELPSLLCRYLECLEVPIIPMAALQKWPPINDVRGERIVAALKYCLLLLDLERCRRDLLMYLLVNLWECLEISDGKITSFSYSEKLYGLYIRGSNRDNFGLHGDPFWAMVANGKMILVEFTKASDENGDLEDHLRKRLEWEKRREKAHELEMRENEVIKHYVFERAVRQEAPKRPEPRAKNSLLERVASRVKSLFD
jgi:hypothetical protein